MLKSRILIGKKKYIIPSVRFEEIEQGEELLNTSVTGEGSNEQEGEEGWDSKEFTGTFIFEQDFNTFDSDNDLSF